ncbi:unnamed protein product [Pseudo-nitzschia multistriata]|uniref:Secreted protein n=1 Tax=Pseudo-nitzschia multistriata TaxID=183589 RepID=A0A448YZI2_9STRA|nr:unnamed protein product [Pseudo-nitzschia multistriata]
MVSAVSRVVVGSIGLTAALCASSLALVDRPSRARLVTSCSTVCSPWSSLPETSRGSWCRSSCCSNPQILPLSPSRSSSHTDWCFVSISMNLSFICSSIDDDGGGGGERSRTMRSTVPIFWLSTDCFSPISLASVVSASCRQMILVPPRAEDSPSPVFVVVVVVVFTVVTPEARDSNLTRKPSIVDESFAISACDDAMAAFWI